MKQLVVIEYQFHRRLFLGSAAKIRESPFMRGFLSFYAASFSFSRCFRLHFRNLCAWNLHD